MDFIMIIAKKLERIGAYAVAGAMFGCCAVGIVLIGKGFVLTGWQIIYGGANRHTLIVGVLGGLEMLFLAPLPFLAFSSVSELYKASLTRDLVRLENAEILVGKAKRLITGLMIAVVSTELIELIVGNDLESKPKSIAACLGVGLIAVLSLYYWISALKTQAERTKPPATRVDK
jgi:hypothetical protein